MSAQQQKRVFVTGGSGFVGSQVVKQAVQAGYTVTALSRTEASDAKLRALGATPVRGDLTSLEVLERESAAATGAVAHLGDAFLGDMSAPYSQFVEIDARAVDAMAAGLKKAPTTDKLLITTSGSTVVGADPNGGETDETWPDAKEPLTQRVIVERHTLGLDEGKEGGVRVVALRLPMFVHGHGGSGTAYFLQAAAAAGEGFYVGDGATRVSAMHVDDAARAYVALIGAPDRSLRGPLNLTAENHITARQLAEAVGRALGLPVRSVTFDEATKYFGPFFARFLIFEDRSSSAKFRRALGFENKGVGLIEDIVEGSYVEVAKGLAKKN